MKRSTKNKRSRSRRYWTNRALKLSEMQHQRIDVMTAELADAWQRSINDVKKDIESWYLRFSSEQGMDLADARKTLDSRSMKALRMDLKEFERKAKANNDGKWTKELQAASARVHLTRLQQIQLQMRNRLYEIYHQTADTTSAAIRDTYTNERYHNEYLRQRNEGKFSDFSKIPERQLNTVLKQPWSSDGKAWSSRIWDSREKLAGELQGELTRVLLQGKSPTEAGKRLAKKMGTGEYQALRLVNTECTYAQSLADVDSFKSMDVDKVQYLATLEAHTCDTCGALDGQVFTLKDVAPGITAPPIHPNCRCTLVPYFEDDDSDRWMRDPSTGKGSQTGGMTYSQWEKKYLIGQNNGKIDIEIDAVTPCLVRMKDGKLVNTTIEPITIEKGQFSDWEFDWYKASQKPDMQVYALKADGDERVQGLISLKQDRENLSYFVDAVESAPWNNKHHKNFKSKTYEGVGPHLFAYACKRSFEDEYGGFVHFYAKSGLVEYYKKTLGALQIGNSQKMYIDSTYAERLVNVYYGKRKG